MNKNLRTKLINTARSKISSLSDSSHDMEHTMRVLLLAEKIAKKEGGDLDIITAAAIFHDVIVYPKNSSKSYLSSIESSKLAKRILNKIDLFPKSKIKKVCISIESCSFTRAIIPDFLEAKILQDADALESTGALSIMRTFSSAGQMNKLFYNPKDPFCKNTKPDNARYAVDLFFSRLKVINTRLHTKTAKIMAKKRHAFLDTFLRELEFELSQIYGN
jgi:uncharacterized protein